MDELDFKIDIISDLFAFIEFSVIFILLYFPSSDFFVYFRVWIFFLPVLVIIAFFNSKLLFDSSLYI